MADRSSVTEVTQIGVEGAGTPGTGVTATRKLRAASITVDPDMMVDRFRPDGTKYETIAALTGESSKGKIDGRVTYDELAYLLASAVTNPTISTVDTTGKLWKFKSLADAPDSPRTLTVERGSSVRAHKAAGHIVTDLTLEFNRKNGAKVSGSTIGRNITDGATLSGGATALDPVRPVLMDDVGFYIADTRLLLDSATPLARATNGKFSLTGRQSPIWTVDPTQPSMAGTIEAVPKCELALKHEADAAGMAMLGYLRTGVSKWLRIEGTSPVLAGTATAYYQFTLDFLGKVAAVGDFGDEEGLVAIEWTFTGVPDATLGGPFEIELTNTLAAL